MSLYYNGGKIEKAYYNGAELDKIYYNNVLVFEAFDGNLLNGKITFTNGTVSDGVLVFEQRNTSDSRLNLTSSKMNLYDWSTLTCEWGAPYSGMYPHPSSTNLYIALMSSSGETLATSSVGAGSDNLGTNVISLSSFTRAQLTNCYIFMQGSNGGYWWKIEVTSFKAT